MTINTLKKIYLIIIVFLIVIPLSCKNSHKNKYLIPEKTLINLLTDIHLADATTFVARELQSTSVYDTLSYSLYIFDKYNVTRQQFDSTLSYYSANPATLEKIYEKVVNNLSRIEGEITEQEQQKTNLQEIKKLK